MDYRFHLRKGGKKLICPACGHRKRSFVPYVDKDENIVDADNWGRCERVYSCGYNEYPKLKGEEWKDWKPAPKTALVAKKPIEFVPIEIVEKSFANFSENIFFRHLVRLFGSDTAYQLQAEYNIGTARNGGTIFWQQDTCGHFRTGKVMYYQDNGRRNHDRCSWFVHTKIRPDFNFRQCFFGLHLVDGTKPVALVESEKTAVIMSVHRPEYIWIACGGANMINDERLDELKRLDMVYPDNGQFDLWEKKTRSKVGRRMDKTVDNAVDAKLILPGDDILDLWEIENYQKLKRHG